MCRVASFVVADYWRKASRKPTIFSLDREVDDEAILPGLCNTVIDDKAIDVKAWLDARTLLLVARYRLVQIATRS